MNTAYNLELIQSLTWGEVFNSWEENEADLEHWIEHYKKRGFNSWRDWRSDTIKDLTPQNMKWALYKVIDPLTNVPKFYGGPFRAWIKNIYGNSNSLPFSEIIKNPQIIKNEIIHTIIKNFPSKNFLVGLSLKNDIVIIEGMHRCCAIALIASKNQNLKTETIIALAGFSGNKIPLLGQSNSPT